MYGCIQLEPAQAQAQRSWLNWVWRDGKGKATRKRPVQTIDNGDGKRQASDWGKALKTSNEQHARTRQAAKDPKADKTNDWGGEKKGKREMQQKQKKEIKKINPVLHQSQKGRNQGNQGNQGKSKAKKKTRWKSEVDLRRISSGPVYIVSGTCDLASRESFRWIWKIDWYGGWGRWYMGVPSAMPFFFVFALDFRSGPRLWFEVALHLHGTKMSHWLQTPPHRDLGISQKNPKSLAREEKRGEKKREGKKTPSETG